MPHGQCPNPFKPIIIALAIASQYLLRVLCEETELMTASLKVYGTDWCYDCRRARQFLKDNSIPYQWIDIDKDRHAEMYVIHVNHGMRSVLTILFSDGTTLTEPSNAQLSQKLELFTPTAP